VSTKQAAKFGQPDRPVGLAEQQGAAIRGDRATVKARNHGVAFDGWKFKQRRVTVCRHWGFMWIREKPWLQRDSSRIHALMYLIR
jgi:hypothetical protein